MYEPQPWVQPPLFAVMHAGVQPHCGTLQLPPTTETFSSEAPTVCEVARSCKALNAQDSPCIWQVSSSASASATST